MKNVILLLVISSFLISCTEVIFEVPQPMAAKSLNSIPEELQGGFAFVILNEKTYMKIGDNYIVNDEEKAFLSDSLVVKKMGNRFVFNQRINEGEDKEGKWHVYVLEDKGCGFVKATSFVINSDSYIEKFKSNYNGTILGEGQDKSIIIGPTEDQFNAILKDDSVNVSIILERIE